MTKRPARLVLALAMAMAFATGVAFASGEKEAGGTAGEQPGEAAAAYGTIEYLEGDVTVNGDSAQVGQTVRTGDRIATGPSARAEIVFEERNIFQLRPDTVLTLAFDENEIREANLEQGAFAAVFDKLRQVGEGQDSFRIRTPTAVGGVRGTTFFVQVEDPSNTYICTCEGRTQLTPFDSDTARTVETEHHAAFRFVETEDGVQTEEASLIYHSDAEMEELAGKIGVTLPWE